MIDTFILATLVAVVSQTVRGDSIPQFFRMDLNVPIPVSTLPMASGQAPAPPAATPSPTGVVSGRWLSPGHTSHLAQSLPAGDVWKVAWSRQLEVDASPVSIQRAGDRVLLQLETWWEVVAAKDGAHVAGGQTLVSDILLHPDGEVFYQEGRNPSMFVARHMRDGSDAFVTTLTFSDLDRTHLSVLPNGNFAAAGIEARLDPHGGQPREFSGLEVWSFGDPPKVDDVGILRTNDQFQVLSHNSCSFLVVQRPGGFVIAVSGAVAFADADLNLTSVITSEFTRPEQLSVDLAGGIHLFVSEPDGEFAYWLLSPQGERLATLPWSRADGLLVMPPVVGYDHRPYLVSQQVIRALDAEGRFAWEVELSGEIGGAAVTADGKLLVTTGSRVTSYEMKDGEVAARILATIEGVTLTTAPILTSDGKLLVASHGQLHRLEPR